VNGADRAGRVGAGGAPSGGAGGAAPSGGGGGGAAPSRLVADDPARGTGSVAIGIDVGGTKVLGVAIDRAGTVVAEERRLTLNEGDALLDDIAEVCDELMATATPPARAGGDRAEVVTVGVGVPGLVDREGVLKFAPNLLGANGAPVKDGLETRLDGRATVQVDNDATCAAAGECAYGAAAGRLEVLFVTVGTGIGGGLVTGGRILRGGGNLAGEIGHMVVNPHGPPCGCGRRGCWERYASGSGLGRIARDYAYAGQAARVVALAGGDNDAVRGEHVVRAAAEADEAAVAILGELAWWLALGLANLANILDPEMIVIGGGLVRAGEALLGPVRTAFASQLEGAALRPEIEIVAASLGERGGAIGSAVLGRG
jgi:glucokinase